MLGHSMTELVDIRKLIAVIEHLLHILNTGCIKG